MVYVRIVKNKCCTNHLVHILSAVRDPSLFARCVCVRFAGSGQPAGALREDWTAEQGRGGQGGGGGAGSQEGSREERAGGGHKEGGGRSPSQPLGRTPEATQQCRVFVLHCDLLAINIINVISSWRNVCWVWSLCCCVSACWVWSFMFLSPVIQCVTCEV